MYYSKPLSNWSKFRHLQPLKYIGKDLEDFPNYVELFFRVAPAGDSLMEPLYEAFAIDLMLLNFLDTVDKRKSFEQVKKDAVDVLAVILHEESPSGLFVCAEEKTGDIKPNTKKLLIDTMISLVLVDIAIEELAHDRIITAAPIVCDAIIICWRAMRFISELGALDAEMLNIIKLLESKVELKRLHEIQKLGGKARAEKYQPAKDFVAEHDDPEKWTSKKHAAKNLTNRIFERKEVQNPWRDRETAINTIHKWIIQLRKTH